MTKMTCLLGLVLLTNVRACVVLIEYDDKRQGETEYSETATPVIDLVAVSETGSEFALLRVSHGGGELPIQVNVGATLGNGFSVATDVENQCDVGTIDAPVENELLPEAFCLIKIKYQAQNIGDESESVVTVTPGEGLLGMPNTWRLTGHTVAPGQLSLAPQTTNDFGIVQSGTSKGLIFDVLYSGESPAAIDLAATETSLLAPFEFSGGAYPGTAGTCGALIDADCTVEVTFSPTSMGIYLNEFVLQYDGGENASQTTMPLTGLGDEEIWFDSEYVDSQVRDILGKMPGDPIYFSETATISRFDSFYFRQGDLPDAHYFPNLTEIRLAFIDSPNLIEIGELTKLEDVFITEHHLTDLSVFAQFNQLVKLEITYGGSTIHDLSPLNGLSSLKDLRFHGSPVTDISGLEGMTFDYLQLHHCFIDALSDLADSDSFFADTIDIRQTGFSCIYSGNMEMVAKLIDKGMTVLTDCEEIQFESENVDAIVRDTLGKLPGDPIYFWELSVITTFGSFYFTDNDLADVRYFPNLTEMNMVLIDNADLPLIAGLSNLTDVFITDHLLTNLSVFAGFNHLVKLEITYGGSTIGDLSPLSGLTTLKDLRFHGSPVSDISGLDGMTFDYLQLQHCNVDALSALADSDSFFAETLDIRSSSFSCFNSEDLQTLATLTEKGMTVLSDCDAPTTL